MQGSIRHDFEGQSLLLVGNLSFTTAVDPPKVDHRDGTGAAIYIGWGSRRLAQVPGFNGRSVAVIIYANGWWAYAEDDEHGQISTTTEYDRNGNTVYARDWNNEGLRSPW